jgi:hypothetical protein
LKINYKKNLSIVAKELFPNLIQDTYQQLMCSYNTDGKIDINPRLTLNEAVIKYTPYVLCTINNKDNWKRRYENIFVNFHDFLTAFDEFFPLYRADNGTPYIDIGKWNHENGKKIVRLLIEEIFYLNYVGMNIQDIAFIRENPFSPEIIRVFLRLSDRKFDT